MCIKQTKAKFWIVVSFIFLVAVFLSFYKLSESPPVWYDEGIFTQVAINMSRGNGYHLQVAPNEFVSAECSTTGLTVTYPISLLLKYFGVNLINARIVMAFFILLAVTVSFLTIKKMYGQRAALYTLLLIVSFAPLYGHGKSVLGEMPGMFFLFCFLYLLHRLEQSRAPAKTLYIFIGLAAGLCAITKPFYLIIIPILLAIGIGFRKIISYTRGGWLLSVIAFALPFSLWLFFQFFGPNEINVLSHYSNPNSIDTLQAIRRNLWSFFSELQPAYFLGLVILWLFSFLIRIRNRHYPKMAEWFAIMFSVTTLLVFVRTSGYYRYFFPGQLMALAFFPYVIFQLAGVLSNSLKKNKKIFICAAHLSLLAIFVFQFYQTSFHSWVADYYHSDASAQLEDYFENYNGQKSIFIYNVPEVAIFIPEDVPYYQYLKISKDIIIGQKQIDLIAEVVPDRIIMTGLFWSENQDAFGGYQMISTVLSRYVVLEKTE